MKVICCACGIDLGEKPSKSTYDDLVSHGYCQPCFHHFMAQMGMSLPEYIEGMDVPVVALTRDRTVSFVNAKAEALLGKSFADVQGFLGGDVFECEYARLPERCGHTVHCSGCTIKNTVVDTLQTGIAHERVPAFLEQHRSDGSRTMDLVISTEKKGEVVFLRIESITEAAQTAKPTASPDGTPPDKG